MHVRMCVFLCVHARSSMIVAAGHVLMKWQQLAELKDQVYDILYVWLLLVSCSQRCAGPCHLFVGPSRMTMHAALLLAPTALLALLLHPP